MATRDPYGPVGDTVGCVYGAWAHLRDEGHTVHYGVVDRVYRENRAQLTPLVGTDAIWQTLAALALEAHQAEPALF